VNYSLVLRGKWIAESFTPAFILNCIRDSKIPVQSDFTVKSTHKVIDPPSEPGFVPYKHNGISPRLSFEEGDVAASAPTQR
jgi:hypothetical protein